MTSGQICYFAVLFVLVTVFSYSFALNKNLTCYQCERNSNIECSPEELLPCPSTSDRCVTHITRSAERGFTIKRECGLGPCGFNDEMMSRGLGLDNCDRSKSEFFCLHCCKENGCNKGKATTSKPSFLLMFFTVLTIVVLNIFRKYQPPYYSVPERL